MLNFVDFSSVMINLAAARTIRNVSASAFVGRSLPDPDGEDIENISNFLRHAVWHRASTAGRSKQVDTLP